MPILNINTELFSTANMPRPNRQQGNDGLYNKKASNSSRTQTNETKHVNSTRPQENLASSHKKPLNSSKPHGFQFPVSIIFRQILNIFIMIQILNMHVHNYSPIAN